MKPKEFMQTLVAKLKERGIDAFPTENTKNNGVVLQGISIRRKNERVTPVFYLESFFEKFKSGMLTMDDIMDRLIVEYEALPKPSIGSIENILNASEIIDRINFRMVNEPRNREMIEQRDLVCHKVENTDLIVLFHITVVSDADSSGCVILSDELMRRYLPDFSDGDELFAYILSRENPVRLNTMEEVLKRLRQEIPVPLQEESFDKSIWILTNPTMQYGAGIILTKEAKEVLSERFPNTKLAILPSSVHEVLVMDGIQGKRELEKLREMVRSVNSTEVSEEEYLSDHVYWYDTSTGEFRIAD